MFDVRCVQYVSMLPVVILYLKARCMDGEQRCCHITTENAVLFTVKWTIYEGGLLYLTRVSS